jgi:hypothetical protein
MFSWLMAGLSSIGAPFSVFLLIVAGLFYRIIAYALKNLSNKYQTNAFLIFAYSLWERKQYTAYQNENKTI